MDAEPGNPPAQPYMNIYKWHYYVVMYGIIWRSHWLSQRLPWYKLWPCRVPYTNSSWWVYENTWQWWMSFLFSSNFWGIMSLEHMRVIYCHFPTTKVILWMSDGHRLWKWCPFNKNSQWAVCCMLTNLILDWHGMDKQCLQLTTRAIIWHTLNSQISKDHRTKACKDSQDDMASFDIVWWPTKILGFWIIDQA